MRLKISISPKRTAQILVIVTLVLVLASVFAGFIEFALGDQDLPGDRFFVHLFSVRGESNIPTWFASSMLMLCSIILATIALGKKKTREGYVLHWAGLSAIFLYISVDEASRIHELASTPIQTALNTGGVFSFAWVIPGTILVLIFLLAYARFLVALPRETRTLFIVAGAIFVMGAIGMEIIGGRYWEQQGGRDFTYAMMTSIEELLEMLGAIVFIYALLSYMRSHMEEIQVRIDDRKSVGAAVELLARQSTQGDLK